MGQIPVSYIQQTPGGQFVPDNRWYALSTHLSLISPLSLPHLSLISPLISLISHSTLPHLSLISPLISHSSLTHLSTHLSLVSPSSLPHLSLISPLISLISPSSLEQLSLIVVPALFLHCRSTVQPLELAQDPRRGM